MNEFMQNLFFGGPSQTETATGTDALFIMLWWYGVFWFVLLMGLMVFWVIKYRRRPGVPAQISPSHNTRLEVFWTVVPSSTLLIMFLLGFWNYMEKMVATGDAIQLEVGAMKWNWSVKYPNGAGSTWTMPLSITEDPVTGEIIKGDDYPIFVVPEDSSFNLRMISIDVIHSFWIPDLRTKMDVFPNRYTGFAFKTPKLDIDDTVIHPETGEDMVGRDLVIFCAEYCGDKHSQMAGTLRVVPRGYYDKWVASQGEPLPPVELGQVVWKTKCSSCHTTDGTTNVGPSWKGGYGYDVTFNNGQTLTRDDNYYRESMLDPSTKIVKGFAGNMPSFQGQLSEEQISGVIAFMKSLSDLGQAELDANSGEGAEGTDGEGTGPKGGSSNENTTPADAVAPEEQGEARNTP